MNFNKIFKRLIITFTLVFLLSSCAKGKLSNENYVKNSRTFFGVFDTEISFTAYTKDKEEFEKYFKFLESEMNRYHKLYSSFEKYDINNVKTINDNAGIKPVRVDKEIIELIEFCIDNYNNISKKTNISIGEVTKLWRAEKDNAVDLKGKLPDENKIKEALKYIDINKIQINKERSEIYINDDKMSLDVGAIAKGYTVEKVMNKLRNMGLKSAIISAGGNVKAIGQPMEKGKQKWGIGIQVPNYDSSPIEIKDVLFTDENCAVTSGDYQRFYYVGEKKYNHIINPETGYPKDEIKSVTVLYNDSALADFLSTSLFLESVEKGKEIINKVPGAEAFWILQDDSVDYTKGMEKYLKSKGADNK